MNISKPSGFLSPFIKQYWGMENCMSLGDSHTQRIIPNGLMELTFYFGDIPISSDDNKLLPDKSFISGQQKSFYDIIVSGNISLFSVTFEPEGLRMFFDLPPDEIIDKNLPLRFINKEMADEVEDELFEAGSFNERILVIENFLMKLLIKKGNEFDYLRVKDSIENINKSFGKINIDKLASLSCLSSKQYERVFRSFVGISPKKFLRIVRFQNAIYNKQINADMNLTELAYSCGYFDQSHMIYDFKKLSGKTPKDYFSNGDTYSDYFSL